MGFSVPCLELKKGKCPTPSPQWGPIEVTQEIPGHPSTRDFSFSSVSAFPSPGDLCDRFCVPFQRQEFSVVCLQSTTLGAPPASPAWPGGWGSLGLRESTEPHLAGDTGSTVQELTGNVSQG